MEEKKTARQAFVKLGQHKNYFLAIFLVAFIGGYAFFFTSTYWMPTESKTSATEIGTSQTLNDRKFTLVSWEYSREDQAMLAEFGVRNLSVESESEYKVSVLERSQGELPSEIIYGSDDLLVIRVEGVTNRWREISIHLGLEGDSSYVKYYTNRQAVDHVDAITAHSGEEYYVTKYQGEIDECETEIENYKSQIMANVRDIKAYESRIIELEANKAHQTTTEIEETDSLISTIQGNIRSLGEENTSYTDEIAELEEKAAKAEENMREYMSP